MTKVGGRAAGATPVVAVAVLPGMPLFEIAVPLEVFATPRPGLVEPPYDVRLCAEDVSSDFGAFSLQVSHGFADLADADTVIVPALPAWDHPVPGSLVVALQDARARGPGWSASVQARSPSPRPASWTDLPRPHTGCTPTSWP